MKKILAVAAFAASSVAPAMAQDTGSNFGGAKAGVVLGYDNVRFEIDDASADRDGFLYGVTLGYDFDLGTAVIGVEGEYTDSTAKFTVDDLDVTGDRAKLSTGRDLYVGARVGFPLNPTLLAYAKAGYTNARAKLSYDDGAGNGFGVGDNLDGYRVGGGLEYAQDRKFVRIEYRYSDYGSYDIDDFGTQLDVSHHQVAVTGGFRF